MSDKLTSVRLHFQREDGSRYVREAVGDEAEKWNQMNTSVASFASVHNANPRWQEVEWDHHELARPSAALPTIEETKL